MSASPTSLHAIANALGVVALAAGEAILSIGEAPRLRSIKADESPLTEADLAAHVAVMAGLERAFPGVPVISEESEQHCDPTALPGDFLLVDPLDGTKDYLSGNGEFTVNIALVRNGCPIAGAVHAPVSRRLWLAGKRAEAMDVPRGAALSAAVGRRAIHVRKVDPARLVACVSRRHGDAQASALLQAMAVHEHRLAGSALKFGLIAQGEADIYARFGATMAWDTAAGQAVLRAAGGLVLGADGEELGCCRPGAAWRNTAFVAIGDPRLADAVRRALPAV